MEAIWSELEDVAWLDSQLDAGATAESIAGLLDCPLPTVRIALLSAHRRAKIEAAQPPARRAPVGRWGPRTRLELDCRLSDPAWLAKRYVTKGRTLEDIAIETGSLTIDVRNALRAAGIVQRHPGSRRTLETAESTG